LAKKTGPGSLSGCNTPTTNGAGDATFSGCKIDLTGDYVLTATAGAATVDSDSFTVTVSAAAKLAFTTQPSDSTGGVAFGRQPVVSVQDAGGNTVTTDASTVSLALTTPAGATLSCTGGNSTGAISGVATFAGCQIDKAGTYTLTATDGSLTSAV